MLLICSFLVATLLLAGCARKEKNERNFEYMPVQMSNGEAWSIIDKDGKVVVKEEYPADAMLSPIYDGVYWVKSGDKYQLYNINNPKRPIIDEEFSRVTAFFSGVSVVSNSNSPIQIINTDGEFVRTLEKSIKRCYPFNESGYAIFMTIDNKEGVIDATGKIVVQPNYETLIGGNGYFLAQKKKGDIKFTILNSDGEKIGELDTEKYYPLNVSFNDGKLLVRNADDEESSTIVLDTKGQKIFDIKKSKAKYYCPGFLDAYMVFNNGEGKYGVANDQGEISIRAKYESMTNLGNGKFFAKKGDKWGVVDEQDETLIDFDYDGTFCMMGDNYLMKDGNNWSLVGTDGKELVSFDNFGYYANDYVEFVDVTAICNAIVEFIAKTEMLQAAEEVAMSFELDIDDYHYNKKIQRSANYDDKLKGDYYIWFDGFVTEEKTHQEQENDGWFTYNRTVSDGWVWTQALPNRVSGKLNIEDSSINAKDLYQSVCSKLALDRTKVDDNTYSKNVTIGGKIFECRTAMTLNGQQISFEMSYNQ